MGWVRGLS